MRVGIFGMVTLTPVSSLTVMGKREVWKVECGRSRRAWVAEASLSGMRSVNSVTRAIEKRIFTESSFADIVRFQIMDSCAAVWTRVRADHGIPTKGIVRVQPKAGFGFPLDGPDVAQRLRP